MIPRCPWKSKKPIASRLLEINIDKGTRGVRARYDVVLPPFTSIVLSPRRPFILVREKQLSLRFDPLAMRVEGENELELLVRRRFAMRTPETCRRSLCCHSTGLRRGNLGLRGAKKEIILKHGSETTQEQITLLKRSSTKGFFQGEIIYAPPPPPISGQKAFFRGGGWGCIF